MYSQNDEEKVILEYANGLKPMRFLEIGAYDGITFSNTYALYQQGWEGVYVEADPECFESLRRNFHGDSECTLINKCVGSHTGKVTFYMGGGMYSTTSKRHRDIWSGHQVPYQELVLDMVDFEELIRLAPGPYSFINIDVEGIDIDILRQIDPKPLKTKLICVECNYQDERQVYRDCLNSKGFKVVHETSENLIGVYEAS